MDEIIAIRADGNSNVGFGHLMRMQALARQLQKRGARVIFLSRNPEHIRDYQVEKLNPENGFEVEDQIVEQILQQYQIDMLIIDSYAYDQARLDRMAVLDVVSVYVDDMNLYEFNVDFLVNGNLYAPQLDYRGKACRLLGPDYLLLREEFTAQSNRISKLQLKDILITFGAADTKNVTPEVLKVLFKYHRFTEIDWHVVIGPVFNNTDEIEAMTQCFANVHIYHNPAIKNLMNNCDIAISAAGSTTYELAACGVPSLLIVVEDNQLLLAQEAQRQGIAINLGWYQGLPAEMVYKNLDHIFDFASRTGMASRGLRLIDGKGAERLADVLLQMVRRKTDASNNRDDKG